jgi:hypothetical protein
MNARTPFGARPSRQCGVGGATSGCSRGSRRTLRYIDYSYWNELSGGSRLVVDVGPTLAGGRLPVWLARMGTEWCHELAESYRGGLQTPDVIVLTTPTLDPITVVEGHVRITGIVLSGVYLQRAVPAFVGISARAGEWMP